MRILVTVIGVCYIMTPISANTLKNQIKQLIPKNARVSVVAINLKSGNRLNLHHRFAFNPASVIKLPIMAAVYQKFDSGDLSPHGRIQMKKSDMMDGSGIMKHHLPGSYYTLQSLVHNMIIHSDNIATKMLINTIGISELNHSFKKLGLDNTILRTPDLIEKNIQNTTTTGDIAWLLSLLHRGVLGSPEANNEMTKILLAQKYKWGIPRFLPKSTKVAHKTGSLRNLRHDAGIVYAQHRPYIVTIFTENMPNNKTAENTVARISKLIFRNKSKI